MFKIHYSEEALADLDNIWEYIAFKLKNPDAGYSSESPLKAREK